jgi:deoxyadenosine/deoxycytidine kinase
MNESKYIAIEGPIGVGKTSLAVKLVKHFNARSINENVEGNPFLSDFYDSRKNYAFQTQMFFLLSRYKQQMSIQQPNLFNQVTISDYIFDRDRIFAYINLDEDEIRLYEEVYSILKPKIPRPDMVIYLQANLDIILERIQHRGRKFEIKIDPSYLEEVNKAFNNYFFHYKDAPLLIINTNKINFVEKEEDFDQLIKKIKSHKKGVEYYCPLGSY